MPIYAYRCASCGYAQDVLQKFSDPVLTDCPQCGAAQFAKQVTAASFHLKGTGWYATDFGDRKNKGANAAGADAAGADSAKADTASAGDAPSAAAPAPAAQAGASTSTAAGSSSSGTGS